MVHVVSFCLVALSFISYVSPAPLSTSPNPAVAAHNALLKRAEPGTGDDDFPDTEPHPNKLDQVETAFNDAFELAAYVLNSIDDDIDIFPHYFNGGDRAGVKNVFLKIFGTTEIPENPSTGNDLLAKIHVQRKDTEDLCKNGRTLAYMHDGETDNPTIILCDNAFKKKAVTALKGADPQKDEDKKWYASCDPLKDNGHVSYLMNTLGATLLHEYLHFDGLVQSVFGAPIIDQDNVKGEPIGYGPVQVYDKLSKDLAPFNADSYTYYALHNLWHVLCQVDFKAPRAGTDDADPDCGDATCQT
ncbi:MAG: hypothetical protein Q9168_006608 [Polycauliona sp. 1 TL-2023]